jgi:heme/copper-type cytochrome/quinol oxidase subunit 4
MKYEIEITIFYITILAIMLGGLMWILELSKN